MEKRSIRLALDEKGHKVVVINELIYRSRKGIPWDKVEQYLKRYIGAVVQVADTEETINIGSDFPDEYKGSRDTMKIRGATAKAKANAIQGILEMIHISKKTKETENMKEKNVVKAKKGWHRYLTRFAVPAMTEENVITHYNVYRATLVVRKNVMNKLNLYDVVDIKKEDSVKFEL